MMTRKRITDERLSRFWSQLPGSGVSVVVANRASDKLLGVREGFRRYFHEGPLRQPIDVRVRSDSDTKDLPLPLSEQATANLALERARDLERRLGHEQTFAVCSEGGLHTVEVAGEIRCFAQTWVAICALGREALGVSSSLQLPPALVDGPVDEVVSLGVPGTRRGGGIAGSLTGGLETRRSGVVAATTNALATLLYGLVDTRSPQRRW